MVSLFHPFHMSVLQPLQSSSSPVLSLAHTQFWHTISFIFLALQALVLKDNVSIQFLVHCIVIEVEASPPPSVKIYRHMETYTCTKCTHAHAVTPSGGRLKSIWLWRRVVEAREKKRRGLKHSKGRGRGKMKDAVRTDSSRFWFSLTSLTPSPSSDTGLLHVECWLWLFRHPKTQTTGCLPAVEHPMVTGRLEESGHRYWWMM